MDAGFLKIAAEVLLVPIFAHYAVTSLSVKLQVCFR